MRERTFLLYTQKVFSERAEAAAHLQTDQVGQPTRPDNSRRRLPVQQSCGDALHGNVFRRRRMRQRWRRAERATSECRRTQLQPRFAAPACCKRGRFMQQWREEQQHQQRSSRKTMASLRSEPRKLVCLRQNRWWGLLLTSPYRDTLVRVRSSAPLI